MQSADNPNLDSILDLEPLNSKVIQGFAEASSYYSKLVNEVRSRAYNKGLRVKHRAYCVCGDNSVSGEGTLPKDYPYDCLCNPSITEVGDELATSNLILTYCFAGAAVYSYEEIAKPFLTLGLLPPPPAFPSQKTPWTAVDIWEPK